MITFSTKYRWHAVATECDGRPSTDVNSRGYDTAMTIADNCPATHAQAVAEMIDVLGEWGSVMVDDRGVFRLRHDGHCDDELLGTEEYWILVAEEL